MTLVITIVDVVWLFSVLVLLLLIWLTNMRHIHRMEITLFEVVKKSADAALASAEAAKALAEKAGVYDAPHRD